MHIHLIGYLVDFFQLLDHHRAGSTATVADGSYTVFTGLQLVQKGDQDAGARASESVADGDGASQRVDTGVFETENL